MAQTAASLKNIRTEKFHAAHHQITRQLRKKILAGGLPPGSKLPSVPQLAKMWDVSSFTVHTALTPLVEAGLLLRQTGRGTFVAEKRRELVCAGIYNAFNFIGKTEAAFSDILHQKLCNVLAAENIKERTWLDSRPPCEQSEPFGPLVEAIRNNEVQCLIAPSINRHDLAGLRNLSVPSVFLTQENIPNKVSIDNRHFFQLAMESLSRKKCRSAGLLTAYRTTDESPRQSFFPHFVETAREFGLRVKDEWILAPKDELPLAEMERFGYDCALALRNAHDRPEGLIVFPDNMVRGVVMGLMTGDCASRSFYLAFHRNKGLEIFCPLPAAWIAIDPEIIARAMLGQIRKRFAGEVVEPAIVPYTLSEEGGYTSSI
jgi:DNA-binding transcriptional regulator YhcF (GntR family)